MQETIKLSRMISRWLRHTPHEVGLIHDDFGWVSISDLCLVLEKQGIIMDATSLEALNYSFDKVRWEIDFGKDRIRATHGHSFPVIVGEAKIPPDVLYHGTAKSNLVSIAKRGLSSGKRQFVHLSVDKTTALLVGSRHGMAVIIPVDAKGLLSAGHAFYHTSDNVWLTTDVPPEYLGLQNLS